MESVDPSAAPFHTPFTPYNTLWYNISAMTKENMTSLIRAFRENISVAKDSLPNGNGFLPIAQMATLIDFMNGDIEGIQSPLSDIARNSFPTPPQIPPGNQDPNPLATACMKRLGELGVQSLFDIKGYKLDGCEHFLLHINGRFADTGWTNGDKRIPVFMSIMDECGITLNRID